MPNSLGPKGVMKRKTFTDFLRDAYAPRKTLGPGYLRGRICLQPNDYHFLKNDTLPISVIVHKFQIDCSNLPCETLRLLYKEFE